MATNTINTRIKLKYDAFSAWNSSSFVPLQGEVCIAEIPSNDSNPNHLSPPAIGIKVGDGSHTFAQLPWIQAIAGDVYSWAKAATKPTYEASEITNLSSYISGQIQDTDTVYRITAGTGNDAGKYFLQSKAKSADDSTFATVSTIDLSSVQNALEFDGTYNSSTNKVATQSTVTNAIEALDVNNISGFGAGKTLSALSETDGKISATFQDISITKSQISDAGTAAGANVATSAITDSDSSSDLATKAQVASYVESKTAGLTGAMHYAGAVSADPTTTAPSGTFAAGDVVTFGISEYVYDGTNWRELGTEGSYALATTTITGTNGLTGGGAISSNQQISHSARPASTSTADATLGSSSNKYVKQIKVDAYGHTFAVEEGDITTYKFAEGTTNGTIKVTPVSGGVDGTASDIAVHGLGSAAYVDVASAIDNSTNANKLVTAGQVSDIVSGLDSSVSATAASGNVYSVLTGVTQTDGKLTAKTEVTLAAIAKTGSIYDVIEHNTVTENNASVNYLVFDCGDASHLITDPT